MKFKSLIKLLVVMLVATIPGVIATAPSSAIGTTTYTSPQWNKILKEAKGQTVNWYMWGGGAKINTYVNDYIGAEAKKLGIPLIGVVDSNHSPEGIDYIIPGNDDSSKAVTLYARGIADAILEGRANAVNDVVKAVAEGSDEFVEVEDSAQA